MDVSSSFGTRIISFSRTRKKRIQSSRRFGRFFRSRKRNSAMLQSCISAILVAAVLAAAPWAPPRTPWGDPDLQGTYDNNNEYATPLERPAEFEGKRASDLTPAEIAEIRRLATQRMLAALPGGSVRGPDDWWLQNLDLTKRSRPWSVV